MSNGSQDLQLIQKVELRFALADSTEKFQSALNIYLAPLLLKFASNDKQVKLQLGKTIKFLLSKFSATTELKLPVNALLDQIKKPNLRPDQDPTMVQSYTLLFLSKAIPRLSISELLELFPNLFIDISTFKNSIAARLFNISCKILDSLSDSDILKLSPCLSNLERKTDKEFIAEKYYKFMLLNSISLDSNGLIPNNISQPGLSQSDCSFFLYYAGVTFNSQTLANYKLKILKLLENTDALNKSIILICASSDSDSKISSFASTCLKRIPIEYEDELLINRLIFLFVGDQNTQSVKSLLQEKIINILCKSKIATKNSSIEKIFSIGLNSSNIRLKQSTVSFVRWFTNISSLNNTNDATVKNIAIQLKLNLSDISIDKSNPTYLDNRRFQYETLGLLLKKSNKLLDVTYIQFLIDMLNTENKELQPTILDSLFGLTNSLVFLNESQRLQLKDFLIEIFQIPNDISSSNNNINQIRFVGVKYINALYPFNDAQARIINILGQSKNDKVETIEESKKGLNPYFFALNNNTISEKLEFPLFDTMVNYILKYKDIINLDVALNFTFRCLIMNSINNENTIVASDQYWETRIDKALEIDHTVKSSLINNLQQFHDLDGDITTVFADSCLKKFIDLSFSYVISTNSLSVLSLLTKTITLCPESVTDSLTDNIPSLLNNDLNTIPNESLHYVSKLTGIICTTPNVDDQRVLQIIDELIKSESLSSAAAVISRLALRGRINIINNESFSQLLILLDKNLSSSSTKLLKISLDAICQLSMFGCLGPTLTLSPHIDSFKEKLIEKLTPLVKKCNESAIYTWCYLGLTYDNPLLSNDTSTIFEKLIYETHTTKQIDNLFSTGEGLAILSNGWLSKNMKDLNDIIGTQTPEYLNPNRCTYILDQVLKYCKTTKPSLRRAACIWLLSIVQYCPDKIIFERISEIQNAFMKFLSDREEIIQEAASRGLSITYESGGYEIQETLIHNLLSSFTDSNKTSKELMSGYIDNDTQLFEEGVLNTGDGESVSTYKDVLNLASEVGNPSLVYKFMSLAKNSALWSSKKGIAFGLSAILDKEKLNKLLKDNPTLATRLIPKLFRYKYDPSPSISRTMNNIWNNLILDNKVTLNDNFDSIIKELLSGMGNREWRIREASTAALQDLLRQCDFNKFENDLEKIWMMAFRAMDDIKSSVRKEGTSLTRYLANIMVLKLNATSNKSNQEAILKQLVPFFLGNNGLLSDSEDVKKFAFETLMKLISTSSGSLKPFVSEIIKQLILLMSSVEPQVINYLTLNADKYKLKVEDIDSQRLGIVGSSPMMEAIEKLMDLLDQETIGNFIQELGVAIKSAIGLPSKAAGSKVIVNLILRHFFLVSNFGDQLLKIASGQLKDKNETVAKSYAIACGYCVRIASLKKIESFGKKLTKYYFEKKSDIHDDDRLPMISSVASESVSNFANDKFQSLSAIFLPLAFIGKHDLKPEIAKNFEKVWSDSTSSSANAIKLYFSEIVLLIKQNIQTQTFSLRKTIALSIIEIIDIMDTRINDLNPSYLQQLYDILLESLTGRVYDGKEKLLDSLVKLACKSQKFLVQNDELYNKVEGRVLNEATRNNKEYKKNSIIALGNFLETYYEDPTLYDKYIQLIDSIIDSKTFASDDEESDGNEYNNKMDVDSTITKTSLAKVTLTQTALLNVVHSISNGKKINLRTLHYVLDKLEDFLLQTNVDMLPNSDSKFKFKQNVLSIINAIIELNKNNLLLEAESLCFNNKVFSIWKLIKQLTSSADNLQTILIGFARTTGLLLETLSLNTQQQEDCIMSIKLLKSENANSVITIECDKILANQK
jgi:proteasome component ECM29